MSGSYAYVAGHLSASLAVVDISNPVSPAIRGSVVSASLLNGVRVTQFCDHGQPQAPLHASAPSIMLAPAAPRPLMPYRALTRSLSRALCTQAVGVAVSGSYAYMTGQYSTSLVVVDISNPVSPIIRGSVVSSSLLEQVRAARSCDRG